MTWEPDEIDEDNLDDEAAAYWAEIARLESIDSETFDYWEIDNREDNE